MIDPEILHTELIFQTARSGGKGGQNVNKVETKVELRFDIPASRLLSDNEKQILYLKLATRLTNEHVLVLTHQTERSQFANKEKVVAKFDDIIKKAFIVQKARRATRPTLASQIERLQSKQRKATVKSLRKKPYEE